MRLLLALAVFAASLWTATSSRLPDPRGLRLDASSEKPQLTALVDSPFRWTSLAQKKRVLQGPVPDRLAALPPVVVLAPPALAGVGAGPLSPRGHTGAALRRPASPRAPPSLRS